jgi:hypothetical protein
MADSGTGLSAGWVAALTIVPALVGGLAGFGGAWVTGSFSYASKDEELRVRLVEIAISILEADPSKTDLTPARGWAMDVIDQKSGVKFSDADRAALLKKPILGQDLLLWKNDKYSSGGSMYVPMVPYSEAFKKMFPGFGDKNGKDDKDGGDTK